MFVLEHQIYVLYMIDMKTLPVEFVLLILFLVPRYASDIMGWTISFNAFH